jgi:hypothetical protein
MTGKLLLQLMLKVSEGDIKLSSFSDFCNSFQSLAAENWKESDKGGVGFGDDQ